MPLRVLFGLVVSAVVFSLAACGGSAANSSPPADSAVASGHNHNPPGKPHRKIQPARIVDDPHGFFSTSLVWPLKNEWLVASHRTFTAVDAGLDPGHPSDGIFGIFRQDYVHVRQNQDLVKVPGSGAVSITRAPIGPKVVGWAQKRGNLDFTSTNGITGTLHLKDDSVTVDG